MKYSNEIKRQAELQAAENKRGEPAIRRILWFPHDSEVRLVAAEDDLEPALSGEVDAFYFGAAPEYGLFAPRIIALIRTDEIGNLKLPADWGTWEDAEELEIAS